MKSVKKEGFKIIGLKIRTTNENMQGAKDIPALWQKFMSENIIEKIPNKIDNSILAVYTNYESDCTKPYDMILGCRVSTLNVIPNEMLGVEFSNSNYANYTAKGNLEQGVVFNTWTKIWEEDLDRTYTADIEVYGDKSQDPSNAEVEIFVAIN